MKMVPTEAAGLLIYMDTRGWEDPLPGPLPPGVQVLPIEGVRQSDAACAGCEVPDVLGADVLEMAPKGLCQAGGKHGDPVIASLSIVNSDLVPIEIEVFDPQAGTFEYAKPRTVHEGGHQPRCALHFVEDPADLLLTQDLRQPWRPPSAQSLVEAGHLPFQDVAEEKEECAERLVLGGGAHLSAHGQVREESRDVGPGELRGVGSGACRQEAPRPPEIGLFRP